jgi:hypothetical protein
MFYGNRDYSFLDVFILISEGKFSFTDSGIVFRVLSIGMFLSSPIWEDVLKKLEWIYLLTNNYATVEVMISFKISNSII